MIAQQTDAGVMVSLTGVTKNFVLHLRGGALLPVMQDVAFDVRAGECIALDGPSGSGKSSILKMIYGNYRADYGLILVRHGVNMIDVASAAPRAILALRRNAIGYVSQFLRVIPRVSSFDLVQARAREAGFGKDEAAERSAQILRRLNLPERLWPLPPATFSGGEQQRVNIACGFAAARPIMLLDEPTASLDSANTDAVIELIEESKAHGTAIIGIFHDNAIRGRVAQRLIDVRAFSPH